MQRFLKIFSLFILFLAAEVLAIVANGGWQDFTTAVNGWSGIGALFGALGILLVVLGLWLYHGAMDYSGKTGQFVVISVLGTLVMLALAGIGLWRIWQPIGKVYTTTLWLPAIALIGALLVYFGRLSRPDTTA